MMRFDMRVPGKTPAEITAQYQAAIEMAQWADDKGCNWGRLPLHPLCGRCPPDLAWAYLRRVVDDVLPNLASSGRPVRYNEPQTDNTVD